MFKITIGIDISNSFLTGLEALDRRRALGLEDGVSLSFNDSVGREAEVSEGFARSYFTRTSTCPHVKVPTAALAKGDVEENQYGVTLAKGLTADRIKEMWLAHRK